MIKYGLILSVLLGSAAFAQRGSNDIGAEAQRLASEIQRESRYLTRDQAARIRDRFEDIRGILYGNNTPTPTTDYTCVSRDNDGRAPWVYGLRDGVNVTRISGTTFTSNEDCQTSARSMKYVGGVTLACISKDNDGRSPWIFAAFDERGGLTKINRSATSSLEACLQLSNRMLISRQSNSVAFCASRDNDGRAPYTAYNLNLAGLQIQGGSESFSDINQCWSFLGSNFR